MDLTTTTAPTKIPETDNETQPNKSFSFTNGGLKKRHHLTAAPPPPAVVVTYKECLKNHAASLGGHALDGCGEFMPSSTATPTNPTSLKCAACGCHRNFHRREPDEPTTYYLEFRRNPPAPPPQRSSPSPSPSHSSSPSPSPSPPPPPPPSYYSSAPHMLLALSTGGPHDDQTTMNHNPVATPATPTAVKSENPSGRKRFRTKFSQEQKEKMLSFSEKLGWKMQKCDERSVEEFCNEVGVGKGVLKVWMHNNKYTLSKRDPNCTATATATATAMSTATATTTNDSNNMVSLDHDGHNTDINNSTTTTNSHHNNEINGVHLHVSTNGSSSSS